jgi:hypothetical protein
VWRTECLTISLSKHRKEVLEIDPSRLLGVIVTWRGDLIECRYLSGLRSLPCFGVLAKHELFSEFLSTCGKYWFVFYVGVHFYSSKIKKKIKKYNYEQQKSENFF